MNGSTAPVVALEGITKAYPGVVANDDITLDLFGGEIHAIVGENGAGKTTLMGVLYGLHRPDAGRVLIDGSPTEMDSPRDALALGLGYVQQHFSLIPTLTVAENLVLAMRGGASEIGFGEGARRVSELADRYGLRVPADAVVEDLGVGDQQRAELLKALARDARVLILDEPDALLTAQEWDELAGILRRLAGGGIGIFLVSHKLRAVLSVAERISVLRRGRLTATIAAADADESRIAELMVGELRTGDEVPDRGTIEDRTLLEVTQLSVASNRNDEAVKSVSFAVRPGEVLGIAGVEGSGQVELTEALAGARAPSSGEITLDGRAITATGVAQRQRLGVAHVPADRREAGLVG